MTSTTRRDNVLHQSDCRVHFKTERTKLRHFVAIILQADIYTTSIYRTVKRQALAQCLNGIAVGFEYTGIEGILDGPDKVPATFDLDNLGLSSGHSHMKVRVDLPKCRDVSWTQRLTDLHNRPVLGRIAGTHFVAHFHFVSDSRPFHPFLMTFDCIVPGRDCLIHHTCTLVRVCQRVNNLVDFCIRVIFKRTLICLDSTVVITDFVKHIPTLFFVHIKDFRVVGDTFI